MDYDELALQVLQNVVLDDGLKLVARVHGDAEERDVVVSGRASAL